MSKDEQIIKKNGYTLHVVPTTKYKTNTFVWKMKAPLKENEATMRALLPHVLQSSTKNFSSSTKLRAYLDDLYGGILYVDLSKKGDYHIISIIMEIANEKFLSDQEPLLKKSLSLLSEIIFQPNAENNAFDKETVEKEKRTLRQRIQSVYDDKMRYASNRLVEEMCKGEPYAIHVNGKIEDIDAITPERLYTYYEKCLNEDEIDLYIVGDVKVEEVEKIADELFHLKDRVVQKAKSLQPVEKRDVNEVIERQDIKQGKLNIGYRTNVKYGDHDYFALQVFNGLFGGFAHSKLFMNVREKASLAYYAASRLESHKGLLLVMSGIEHKNFDKTVDIIHKQMEAMKNGVFSENEILQTKAVIKNQLLETMDTSRGLVEVLYHNVISQQNVNLSDWIERIEQVTKEEIISVANKIQLDTIYFLTGNEVA